MEVENRIPQSQIRVKNTLMLLGSKIKALKEFKTQSGLLDLYSQWGRFRAQQAVLRHHVHGTPGMKDIQYAEAFFRYTPWTRTLFALSQKGC